MHVCKCICTIVHYFGLWVLRVVKDNEWLWMKARWTPSLPQTSRANPVQCCSTHQKKKLWVVKGNEWWWVVKDKCTNAFGLWGVEQMSMCLMSSGLCLMSGGLWVVDKWACMQMRLYMCPLLWIMSWEADNWVGDTCKFAFWDQTWMSEASYVSSPPCSVPHM